jgi:hypothetical protein
MTVLEIACSQFKSQGESNFLGLARDCDGYDSSRMFVEDIVAEDQHRTKS